MSAPWEGSLIGRPVGNGSGDLYWPMVGPEINRMRNEVRAQRRAKGLPVLEESEGNGVYTPMSLEDLFGDALPTLRWRTHPPDNGRPAADKQSRTRLNEPQPDDKSMEPSQPTGTDPVSREGQRMSEPDSSAKHSVKHPAAWKSPIELVLRNYRQISRQQSGGGRGHNHRAAPSNERGVQLGDSKQSCTDETKRSSAPTLDGVARIDA